MVVDWTTVTKILKSSGKSLKEPHGFEIREPFVLVNFLHKEYTTRQEISKTKMYTTGCFLESPAVCMTLKLMQCFVNLPWKRLPHSLVSKTQCLLQVCY